MDFCQLISSEEEEEVDHLSALSADYNRHSRGRRRMMDVRIFDGGRNMCGTMVLKVLEWLVENEWRREEIVEMEAQAATFSL